MNAIAERWIGGCRRELLDRTLIWNQLHLRRILRQYETHHNQHRPHRSPGAAAPLKPLPQPVVLEQYRVRRRTRVSGTIHEYRLVALADEIFGTHSVNRSRCSHVQAPTTLVAREGPAASRCARARVVLRAISVVRSVNLDG
jgi:hypothetical protein